jgi:uncharacterized protein GlcG (DUF336 family)
MITSVQASQVITQAIEKAREIGVNANITIVDTAGYLKLFHRMDDAFLGSIDIAMGKAKTSMLFRMNAESVGAFLDGAHGMVGTNGGLVAFKGGMAVKSGDETIGYIGVSGGSPDQDFEIATAGSIIYQKPQ